MSQSEPNDTAVPDGGSSATPPSPQPSSSQPQSGQELAGSGRAPRRVATGRPTEYTPELAAELCERIAGGETLTAVCEDEHMPDRRTVHRWLLGQVVQVPESFRLDYTRAREAQAEHYFDSVISIVDESDHESMADIAARRLRFDARRWVTARIAPWKYGDKIAHEHTGKGGGAISVVTGIEAAPGSMEEPARDADGEEMP